MTDPMADLTVQVLDLRAEGSAEALVASATPRLSWRVGTGRRGWQQLRAELCCELDGQRHSAVLHGADCVLVPWPLPALPPNATATVRLRVQGRALADDGRHLDDAGWSDWSAPRTLLTPVADFGQAEAFITVAGGGGDADRVQQYRIGFELPGAVRQARLSITAFGIYQAELNAAPVGDAHLAPGWTAYTQRLLFQTHDVTALLQPGANSLGVWVAPGWFGERYGFFHRTQRGYHGPLALCARLEVQLADGRTLRIATGPDWQGRDSGHGVLLASLYHGETRDWRAHQPDWAQGSTPVDGWAPCQLLPPLQAGRLQPDPMPPVRTIERLQPHSCRRLPNGHWLVDFGQNLVGVVRLRVDGPAGHVLTLRHAEDLDEQGQPSYASLRTARATAQYVLDGRGPRSCVPAFSFHGFRYAEVQGWPGDEAPAPVAEVWQTDLPQVGMFDSDHPLLNQLWANTLRSLRGNLVAVPTDCPQRDERLGWTGDLQVFLPAATSMLDLAPLVSSWLQDLALEQARAGGPVPVIVPAVLGGHDDCVAGWGDVAVLAPWTLYQRCGDLQLLRRQWPSMVAWLDAVQRELGPGGLWDRGMQIGDHLAPQKSAWFPGAAATDPVLLASAHLARSAALVASIAGLIGEHAAQQRFAALAARTRQAVLDEYVSPGGRIVSDSVTAYALLIVFGLAEGELAQRMGAHLAERLAELDDRIGTGFLGTPLVMDALVETGQLASAARLLLQTQCPSWLYPVTQGATSIWERWDLRSPDGRLLADDLGSANHYALGAVCDWLQRRLAGLAPAAPGYREIAVRPCILPGLGRAHTRIVTPYGLAMAGWRREGEVVHIEAELPPNTRGQVHLPGHAGAQPIAAGRHAWTVQLPEPPAPAPVPLGLHSPLSHIRLDGPARALILAALKAHEPHRAGAFEAASSLLWRRGVPLHAALMFVHPRALQAIEDGLAALNAARRLTASDPLPGKAPP